MYVSFSVHTHSYVVKKLYAKSSQFVILNSEYGVKSFPSGLYRYCSNEKQCKSCTLPEIAYLCESIEEYVAMQKK